jgi:hypothetical protein
MEPHDEHIEYIKQAASRYLHTLGGLRAKLMDYHSYLYTLDGLDDLLGRLADRHGKVMDSMIADLQNIGFNGCGMRCAEPHYQEQNDHPLTYLVATFGLSLPATTVLACADKATLEELAMKVAEQQTKMKRNKDSAWKSCKDTGAKDNQGITTRTCGSATSRTRWQMLRSNWPNSSASR